MHLKIKRLHPDAILPKYATPGAACFDLHALHGSSSFVADGTPQTFRTGLAFEIPPGWAMLIYSRSGHGFKNDTRLANCVGVIDSDYRGEVMVRLSRDLALSSSLMVAAGDRIAQAMLVPVAQVTIEEVDEIGATARGAGGFGSTGA